MSSRNLILACSTTLVAAVWIGYAVGIPPGMLVSVAFFVMMWLFAAWLPMAGDRMGGYAEAREGASKRELLHAVICLGVFPPLLIVLHELGHYLAAQWLGYSATFTYAEILFKAPSYPRAHAVLLTAAGPMVEVIFAAVGTVGLWRHGRSKSKSKGVGVWLLTACSLAGLRWMRVDFSEGRSDEARLSTLMGAPGQLLPAVMIVPALLAAATLLWAHRSRRSMLPLAAGFAAAVVSAVAWLTWVGPAVFPHPTKASFMKIRPSQNQQ
jgi:hypothetical protein